MKTAWILLAATSALVPASVVHAQTAPVPVEAPPAPPPSNAPQIGSFGFDEKGMDKTAKPGEDFDAFANGSWKKQTAIPADKSNYGMFTALDDLSQERVRGILDAVKDDKASKIGNAYASFLDEAGVEAKGLKPIQPWLGKIRALKNKQGLAPLIAQADRSGIGHLFGAYVGQDDKNPDSYILTMVQSGLGLPDRDYYLLDDDRMKTMRAAYAAHVEKMLTLAGEADGAARAQALLAFETEIAKVQWTREDSGDATKTYNKLTVADLAKTAPGFDFAAYFKGIGAKSVDDVLVAQPSAFTGIAALTNQADLNVIKDLLIVRSLDSFADQLPKAITDENFAFYDTILNGTPENQPRWKRAVDFTGSAVADEVGKLYVAQYFPPETKAAMDALVKNVLEAMGRRIDGLEWMTAETKVKARAKLAGFTTKIGYPDRWRDFSGLVIKRDDLFGNALRSRQFEHDYGIGKLGQPIYRWEWGMTPMTVNAYANFGMNEIVFPAAILQPPFFDPKADPAVNYGGIGAVIGHEVSHHFDDQGAKYDVTGKLSDWWTPKDVENFKGLTDKLVKQYDAYEPFPGAHVKGEFTLGENIGDLAGVSVAYDAWRHALNGKEPEVIDGYTGDQRFYLGWAQVWRRNYREENLRQRLLTDPHSPSAQRVWVVRNFDSWYKAYNPAATDRLYLKPEERVRIW